VARRELHADRVERMKLMYDLSKHITTLSTGTLLLMAGLFDKVFKLPVWTPLAGASVLCFALCVVCCVIAMFGFAMYSQTTWQTEEDPVNFGSKAFSIAIIIFVFGIISFTIFSIRNIY
jgi:uncharacterized membrane protein YidH (DUF202 family)